jgi:hypothetical protein
LKGAFHTTKMLYTKLHMTGSIWGTHFTDLVHVGLNEHEYVVSVWTFIVNWKSRVGDLEIIEP